MGLNMTAADKVLKDFYEGPVRDQLNSRTILLSRIKKNTKAVDATGRKAIVPVHYGRNVGVGARMEDHPLPTAGNQEHENATWYLKRQYARIKLSGMVMEATRDSVGSFVRALRNEMDGAMTDSKVNVNRQLWHDGTAILTVCGTTAASTTVVVSNTKFLKAGMPIDVRVMATGAESTGALDRTVVSVDSATTFTISGAAITTDATFAVYPADTRGLSSETPAFGAWGDTAEIWGLEGLCDDADPSSLTAGPGGLAKATYSWWRANMLENGGTNRALSLDLMQQAFDLTEIEGDDKPGFIATNHAIKRRYAALLQADKRYPAGGEIKLDGGYSALEFNGVPLVADKDASLTRTPGVLNRIYFLCLPTFERYQLVDWEWMQKDGSILKWVSGYDQYEAALRCYFNVGCNRPNANSVLGDILES